MGWQNIQHHPVTFWVLTFITLVTTIFGIYAFIATQPSRELSYAFKTGVTLDLDSLPGLSLTVQGKNIDTGKFEVAGVDIWNSGNQEIHDTDFLRPLQLQTESWSAFKWSDPKVTLYGIDESQVEGNLAAGMKIKSLFPKSGLKLVFLVPQGASKFVVTGAINGGNNSTNGIVNRTIVSGADFLKSRYVQAIIAVVWIASAVWLYLLFEKTTRLERIMQAIAIPSVTVFVLFLAFGFFYNMYSRPPF